MGVILVPQYGIFLVWLGCHFERACRCRRNRLPTIPVPTRRVRIKKCACLTGKDCTNNLNFLCRRQDVLLISLTLLFRVLILKNEAPCCCASSGILDVSNC